MNLPGRHPVKQHQAFRQAVRLFRSLCLLFLGILPVVPAALAAKGDISIAEHKVLYQAWQLLDQGKPGQSLDVLDRSLSPKSAPAQWFLLRGNVLLELNRDEEAGTTFSRGAQRYPEHERLQYNQAVTAYQTGRWEQAARSFVKAFELGRDPERLFNAAAAWHQAGQNQQALQILDSLVQRVPGRSRYWRLRARMYLEEQDLPRAASALEIAYALQDPDSSEWTELARLYQAMNAPLAAAEKLARAAGKNPGPHKCQDIASLFARAYRLDEALRWINRALNGKTSASFLAHKAEFLYRFGNFEMAIQTAEQALELDEQLGSMAMLIGLSSCQLQDWQRAEIAFIRARRVKDTQQQAKAYLASLQALRRVKAEKHRNPQEIASREFGG